MELTELLATACAVVLLPPTRNAEPDVVPTVMPKLTLFAVAVMTPWFTWLLASALDGTPAPKVVMLRLLVETLPNADAAAELFANVAFELSAAAPVPDFSANE
jgi:hypothetical protein